MSFRRPLFVLPLVAVALLHAEPALAADGPATLRLSLEEALARARRVSPRVAELRALRDASRADLATARAGRRPEMEVTAGYQRLSNVPELTLALPDGSRRTLFPNIPDNYSSRLSLHLPLYSGGAVSSGIEAARLNDEAAGSDLAAGTADLDLEVTRSYLHLVLARQRTRVLLAAIASFEAHLKDAANRVRFGLAAENERLAVQVERDRAELQRLQADNDAVVAEADLARLLDLAPDTSIEPTAPPAPPETETAEDVRNLIDHAVATRPARAALADRVRAAEASVELARAALRPRVSLAGGYDFARPNRRILPPEDVFDDSWDVGVQMRYRVFDGGRAKSRVAAARARASAARSRLDSLDRAIALEVSARVRDLETASATVAVADRALASAKENLRVAHDRFRQGLIPSSELLDAESALLRAGLDQSAARVDARLAKARFDRAVGR